MYQANARYDSGTESNNRAAKNIWKENQNYVTPFIKANNLGSTPDLCSFPGVAVSPDSASSDFDDYDADDTLTDDITYDNDD